MDAGHVDKGHMIPSEKIMPLIPPKFPNGRRVVSTPGRDDIEERRKRRGNQASYDADQTTADNMRHWSRAHDVPAPWANNRRTRTNLRVRSRYECDNNTYCRGMVSTIGTDVMGADGPQLCVLSKDHGFNSYVEEEWKRWAQSYEVNLPAKLILLDEARRVEGEGFLAMFTDTEAGATTGHSLNVNVLGARRVINPQATGTGLFYPSVGNIYNDDGVMVDITTGRPIAFEVSSELDDLRNAMLQVRTVQIKARYCRQWFGPTRTDQFRGVSEIQAALPIFAYMRRMELATISAAEIIASLTAFMKTQSVPQEGPAQVADFSTREITRGMMISLPDGWEPVTLDPKQPAANYEMFFNVCLRGVGRVLNMPFGVVAGDHSKYNFASGRLDYRLYDDRNRKDQTQCNIRIMNPVHAEWLAEFSRVDPRVAKVVESGDYYHSWRYSRRPSISPLEDAQTEDLRLKNGTTTYAEVYADRGEDWEEAFEQRDKETEKIAELGLAFPGMVPSTPAPAPAPPPGTSDTTTGDTDTSDTTTGGDNA